MARDTHGAFPPLARCARCAPLCGANAKRGQRVGGSAERAAQHSAARGFSGGAAPESVESERSAPPASQGFRRLQKGYCFGAGNEARNRKGR